VDREDDFRQFVAARQRALLRTAWLLTGDWGTAEDLVQTALVRAWPHWVRIGGGRGADAYVRKIMVNTSTDWRGRRWRGEVPTAELPESALAPPGDSGDAAALQQALLVAVRALPPRQRAVVVLRYFEDRSEASTAEILGCSVGTVKSQASRALETLRRNPALADLDLLGSAS
jgi:RNA polymerase sigma-70 factor (sigma-E family)